jgi:hypothetical protein
MSDISTKFGYVNTYDADGHQETEPALGITPIRIGKNLPVYAIPLSLAYQYADAETLASKSFHIAEVLGFFPDRSIASRISDVILNYLPDLIKMSPYENKDQGKENGEGKVLIDGEVVSLFGTTTSGQILR